MFTHFLLVILQVHFNSRGRNRGYELSRQSGHICTDCGSVPKIEVCPDDTKSAFVLRI